MRGQVTLFIVIGLLLLIFIGLFFFLKSDSEIFIPTLNTESVESMIQSCIVSTGTEGLRILGEQGNYMSVPSELRVNDTGFWVVKYANVMPVLNSSVDEFQTWFDENFANCVDFSLFPDYDVSFSPPHSRINYGAEDVIIDVNFPVVISKGDNENKIDNFQEVLNTRYRRVFERARDVVTSHYIQNFDPYNALKNVDKKDFIINYEINDENNLLFTIIDENSYEGGNFVFRFATNLNRSDIKRTVTINASTLSSPIPYPISSPDRRATLTIFPGTRLLFPDGKVVDNTKGEGNITVFQTYEKNAYRNITYYVSYSLKGGKIKPESSLNTEYAWNLTYPVYNFGPSGLKFYDKSNGQYPQPMTFFWDDIKNPNFGPMGLLYRGSFSDYEWTPVRTEENYNDSYLSSTTAGFSKYTPVDCSFQSCKEATVKSTSKTQALCWIMVALLIIIIIVVIVTFGSALVAYGPGGSAIGGSVVGSFSMAFSAAINSLTFGMLGTVGAGAAVGASGVIFAASTIISTVFIAAAIGFGALTFMGAGGFDATTTAISFTPTCDQVLEISCVPSGAFKSGIGQLGDQELPTGNIDIPVQGGEKLTITAMAKTCKKKLFTCKSCALTCGTAYK